MLPLNLAELAAQAGQVDRARDLYEQSLAIAEELAAADPANTTYRRDLSLSYDNLAELARTAGKSDEADEWASKALAIKRQLNKDEPETP